MPRPITRALARKRGLPRFYTGIRCKRGHTSERFTANNRCVTCQHNAARGPNGYRARWRASHPVEQAMHASIGNARARSRKYGLADPVPQSLDYSTLLPVFAEYVKRKAAGEDVHVHHKVSLLLGGLVVAPNLAVVTAEEHRAISRVERPLIRALSAHRRTQRSA